MKVKAGEALFLEGEAADCLYLLQKGAISIRKKKSREFVEIAKITAGQVIGELAFFDKKPRSASAVAIMDSELVEIKFKFLEAAYSNIPSYMRAIMASLAFRLRQANEQIQKLTEGKQWGTEMENFSESFPSSPPSLDIPLPTTPESTSKKS